MSRIQKIHEQPIVYLVDYSDLKVAEMIELLHLAKDLVLLQNNPCSVIAIFNDRNFTTPSFMREAEKINSDLSYLIQHQAMVGLNSTKKVILKGFNLLLNRDYKSFDTVDEALQHLLRLASSRD